MGVAILAIGVPVAVWGAFRVRRDDAEVWHTLAYAAAAGLVAIGIGWVSGFGLVGIVFFPVGALLAIADALFRIAEWVVEWFA